VRYGNRARNISDTEEMYTKTRSEGFGAEVKRRIMLGTFALSGGYYDKYYGQAQKVRTKITDEFKSAFKNVDFILTPATPSTAFELGGKTENPLSMYQSDVFTASANLAGIPAISIPAGTDKQGLPFGVQIFADKFDEGGLLKMCKKITNTIYGK
jgi:aspartyl/glutamyl-tRNA(Asn/Gln) amidotransferase subunit A (EC 6.3.5.-)